jgi:hypothetical protein
MRQMHWADIVQLGFFPEWGIGPWDSWEKEVEWMKAVVAKYPRTFYYSSASGGTVDGT